MFSPRLRHVLTRSDLALLLAPTYAASANVDFDEAHERMQRAVAGEQVAAALYDGLSAALETRRGSPDEVIDKLSAGVQKRRSRMKAFSDADVPLAHVAATAPSTSAALTARVLTRRERSTMSAGS